MEDPGKEIAGVAILVTAAVNPEIQKASVLRYYASDVAFHHPLCAVPSNPDSRNRFLAILQWYRIMSPKLLVHVSDITYDKEKSTVYLTVTQTFHIRWSLLSPAPSRLLVRLTLRQEPSATDPSKTTYVISKHEDFYHPDDLAALVVPPLIPFIRAGLHITTLLCWVLTMVFSAFGYWVVKDGEGGRGVTVQPSSEPLPPVTIEEVKDLRNGSAEGEENMEMGGNKEKGGKRKNVKKD